MYATFAVNGAWFPVDLLPGIIREAALAPPFAVQLYFPAQLWQGLRVPGALLPGLLWAAALTLTCLAITARERRRLEPQEG